MSGDTDPGPWDSNPVFPETAKYNVRARYCSGNNEVVKHFQIFIDGVMEVDVPIEYTGGWTYDPYAEITIDVTTANEITAGEHVVKFYAAHGNYNIDWIEFEAIPEPATISLLASGVGILFLRRRMAK